MPNRLADATSPYLLQHAGNPVDWYPWGPEALQRAKSENKPIFLSIGYAACHWCHVMEHQVFENPAIAAFMNEHFINIKVDREERPDLDDLYMLATQIMTGQGGWPMSVWLTPDLEPFYAGTYFPPEDAYGRPGFVRLEKALADAWANRRSDLMAQSQKVVEAIRMHADESAGGAKPVEEIDLGAWLAAAVERCADRFDAVNGGLGSAPKFPPHQHLALWLEMLARADALQLSHANRDMLRKMLTRTLDGMMRGGIYEHLAGGFARYSTDERWLVPHFEKMLYDNAQLAPIYARAGAILNRPDYAQCARHTLDFWLREMTDPNGGFYSSLDADSEGAEGKFYVWTLADVRDALGNTDAAVVIDYFGLTEDGNWHEAPVEGASVLAPSLSLEALAQKYELPPEQMQRRLAALLETMRLARAKRPAPGLDDKVLTSWNGLLISALAICGRVLEEPRFLSAAQRAVEYLFTAHMHDEKLLRVSRPSIENRKPKIENPVPAFLDDHAYLLQGLLDLTEALPPAESAPFQAQAGHLAETLSADFADTDHGGFFFTGPHHERLFARLKNAADNATPSANAVAIRALLTLARQGNSDNLRETALHAVGAFAAHIDRHPDYFPTLLLALLEESQAAGESRPAPQAPRPVDPSAVLHLTATAPTIERDGTLVITLRLTVAAGYHIQSHQPADKSLVATAARLRTDAPILSQDWTYPPPQSIVGTEGYAGTVEFQARCQLSPATKPGRYPVRAIVEAQPCTDTACLAPQTVAVDLELDITG